MTEEANLTIFRDCLSETIVARADASEVAISKISRAEKKRLRKQSIHDHDMHIVRAVESSAKTNSSEDMADFVEYLATEIFPHLPHELRNLTYSDTLSSTAGIDAMLSLDEIESISGVMPLSVQDSLFAYGLMDTASLLRSVLPAYATSAAAPPPVWALTRPEACQLCHRDWINLTYHHLIPRSVHDKALTRGWHEERELNRVAWLCGACHRCVHRVATNEELAQHWDTVEKLQTRDDVQRFVQWIGGVRWKKK